MEGNISIFLTRDGSTSLLRTDLKEPYHSRYGAVTESRHVFLREGLEYFMGKYPCRTFVRIFETGLGTGLNALITGIHAADSGLNVRYHSIECNPIPPELVNALIFPQYQSAEHVFLLQQIHSVREDVVHKITPSFAFRKFYVRLEDFVPQGLYDIIYYDAFSPLVQPELWTSGILQKLYDMLERGGILVTYCSRSVVRKTMVEAGFIVEKIPGPPGKREMVRATRP
ncbi:MAG: tRNA (5-methylaminomethyl-2-thiouridine)(34)-methyltransferase MnmD [Bacteroidia bacterium]|nr:tRNA (5-methylaminomethyl-2-thiouridine)(34)-methyltransferase MnmD [Bacteroidia bacterium]